MTRELWLCRDEAWLVFDTKESKDIMGCPQFGDKSVLLSESAYQDYRDACKNFYAWQRKLSDMLDEK